MHRTRFLQRLIDHKHARTYLEIGVFEGENFLRIKAPWKFAVDPDFHIWRTGRIRSIMRDWRTLLDRYYEMPSDAFFAQPPRRLTRQGIDVALVDGLHTHQQSLRDVLNCLRLLNANGVIVMHDCSPGGPVAASAATSPEDAWQKARRQTAALWNGDVWKTVVWLRSQRDDLRVFTLDCDFGLCVAMRGTPEDRLAYSPEAIESMTYEDLAAQRARFLNLKPPSYADEFLSRLPSG